MTTDFSPFACAPFIKEVGRGARGARSLSSQDTRALYDAILNGRVSELELGAILMAYRIKGETAEELSAMLAAAQSVVRSLSAPVGTVPVVIPSYNGARRQPNLVPLLAKLLARDGVPVLVHGVLRDPGRVTTAEIFQAMEVTVSSEHYDVERCLVSHLLAFAPIEVLSPELDHQLSLRATMGVRNTAHTLVKLLQPFDGPALRLVNYTHPAYRETLVTCFSELGAALWPGVMLARGTEGEAVSDPVIQRSTLWLHEGMSTECLQADSPELREALNLPSREAEATADWIQKVLAGDIPVPAPIARQHAAILSVVTGALGASSSPP